MSSSAQSQNVSRKYTNDFNVSDDVKKDIDRLISEGNTKINSTLINSLRNKYNDVNLVDMIIENLSERVNLIQSRAEKFAKAIIKHSGESTPLHTLLQRALKYKSKLELSDAEFEFFRMNLYKQLNATGKSENAYVQGYEHGNTNISRALGTINVQQTDGMVVEQSDFPYLQEIIKQHSLSKQTHSGVVVQHFLYREFAGESMLGKYDSNRHNASCYVHPVIAALFLPKNRVFEETFLLANISYIVRCRYEKTPVMTGPDYILMCSLISDPTDVVCDMESPFKDLRNRALLQETLWQSVLALRNGRYYDCVSAQFLSAVDNCKISNYDAPDVIYVGDEATILRRLFQAFSFRPIIVSSMPLYGVVAPNTANFPVMMNRVTAIPMITLRLPLLTSIDQESVSLESSLSTPQYYMENGTLVPKIQQIVYTRGVIVFHVTRRTQQPTYQTMIVPQNWMNLLPSISSYEKINLRSVNAEPVISLGLTSQNLANNQMNNSDHYLQSVVVLNVNPIVPDLIIGSATVFVRRPTVWGNQEEYYTYNPQMAAIKRSIDGNYNQTLNQDPISKLWRDHDETQASYNTLVSKYGTIYVYVTDSQRQISNSD
jgi:hypothetical protein